jgi:CheY-like chemotaxis protein
VVSNLVLNALDSMGRAGLITIRAHAECLVAGRDGWERIDAGSYAILEVEDTGSGISSEHLPRVLEPFFTTKRSTERSGTGLGLAIVHRIVKDAQGFIDIQTQLGRGTTFSLYFPLALEQVISPYQPPSAALGGDARILVVDDEPVQLRTAQRILRHLGYTVDTAQSGEKAIDMCQALSGAPPYDLLIVDMIMPGGLDGLATVARIRQSLGAQKVLIASGYAPEHLNVAARKRGLPWLAKPYTLASVASAVRGTLAGSIDATTLDLPDLE